MKPIILSSILLSLALAITPAHAAKGGKGGGNGGGGGSEPPATGNDPILFVHGWNSSGSVWNTMISRFEADGYTANELFNWSYDHRQSNATTAMLIEDKVNEIMALTGASKVDIITHSMGGLSSRYYLKFLNGTANVDAWVSLGGPNHGTDFANFCFDTSCYEMRIGSNFLDDLNAGDETPGSVRYGTWRSPCDTVINPDSSVTLKGADNTRTGCISHNGLPTDAGVYQEVRAYVQ
ncbi:MAG: alpha/beta fold hydrolase [Oleiphilaceae bacterium]|nr:alpha/beta fold hydrolase [Oleiphilaceae bacterium]